MSSSPYHEIGFTKSTISKIKSYGLDYRYILYRAKWNLLGKRPFATAAPIHVDIETASSCNLKCTMCPHGKEGYDMEKGIMKDELARKIIKDCIDSGVTSIKLSGRGEALLNKHLVDYVHMAKQGGILDVMFNTNALLLTEEKSRALVDAGLDLLIISIDGSTKDTYNAIRIGSDYDTVIANLNHILDYKKSKSTNKPMIRLQFVKMEENIHEFEEFNRMWKDKVDVIVGLDFSDRTDGGDKSAMKRVKTGRAYCPHPFRRLTINSSGKALMCCVDWDNKYPVGDMNTDTIKDVWHGKRIQTGRTCIKNLEHNKIPSCRDCFSPISYTWKTVAADNANDADE